MIVSLSIKNFILIKEISLVFAPGMNVITGMTGGGKSLVLKALDFLLGARPSPDMVYPGETFTEVSALFTISTGLRKTIGAMTGIAIEDDDDLVIRRRYRSDKSNVCFINGSSALVSDLKKVGELLVDYLAQNHQLQLQKRSSQLNIFDAFADAQNNLEAYTLLYKSLKEKENLLDDIQNDRKDVSDRLELLQHACKDLDALDPQKGEDEDLKKEIAVYENHASIISSFQEGISGLYESDMSAYDMVQSVIKTVDGINDLPDDLAEIAETAENLSETLRDLANHMRGFIDGSDFSEGRFDEINQRFNALQDAKNRYSRELDELIAYRNELPDMIEELKEVSGGSEKVKKEIEEITDKLCAAGKKVETKRKKGVVGFEKQLTEQLTSLGLEQARFSVNLKSNPIEREHAAPAGFSSVEFLFSANPGTETQPLRDVASGGELSRIMLAMQSLVTKRGDLPMLLFDEIDSDIGGRLGDVVGKMMRKISRTRQILCITHLPQLACYGDHHVKIEKTVSKGNTFVSVHPLENEIERIDELAHMLSGEDSKDNSTVSEVTRMLERAKNG